MQHSNSSKPRLELRVGKLYRTKKGVYVYEPTGKRRVVDHGSVLLVLSKEVIDATLSLVDRYDFLLVDGVTVHSDIWFDTVLDELFEPLTKGSS